MLTAIRLLQARNLMVQAQLVVDAHSRGSIFTSDLSYLVSAYTMLDGDLTTKEQLLAKLFTSKDDNKKLSLGLREARQLQDLEEFLIATKGLILMTNEPFLKKVALNAQNNWGMK